MTIQYSIDINKLFFNNGKIMEKTISKNRIIQELKADKNFLKQNFGVINIGLFGSYAKDQQTPTSDIDLLVEFKEPRFDWIASLQAYMEQRFDKKIEIVRKRKLSKSKFFDRIEREVIYA
jgi:predicted nucleotidyltransferase